MAGSTPYFGLSYFDFRDRLDSGINIQKEIDRFLVIDKQLYGLYFIFGNGVVSGWEVSSRNNSISNSLSVSVSAGIGIIDSVASETSSPVVVQGLPPNDRVEIYAVLTGGTISTRSIDFIWSRSPLGSYAIRLASVTTSNSDVSSIDTSVKDEISFLETIKDEIAKHKHRGTPSKIDLSEEVKGQLPGARIEDFDASKIDSGRFNVQRIPILDHNSLDNNGLLSHAALDSFVRTLSTTNRELLGEVSSVNLMKHILFLKYLYPDSDKHMSNMISVIPGVSSNALIDFDSSTANIDLFSQCISGKPVEKGEINSIFWDTTSAFLHYYDKQNVTIGNDQVTLTRGGIESSSVENFENVPKSDFSIPGFNISTEVIEDNLYIVSDSSDTYHSEGFYSGKFGTDRTYRVLYSKDITKNKDWSSYDEIFVDIKSISLSHGAVYMYFVNSEGDSEEKSQEYLILGEDEITSNSDSDMNSFERRSFSIANTKRDDVRKLVIYTDDTVSKHNFWIDNIVVKTESLYASPGFIRFRYSGGVPVLFNSINYDCDIPEDTELRIRIRTANSPSLISRATFSSLLNSGDVFAKEGTDAEIDIVFISNENKNQSPVLKSLELQMIVAANDQGFVITNAEDWDKGEYINTGRKDDSITYSSSLVIDGEIPVGNMYFSYLNTVQEIDDNNVSVYGVSGYSFPLSPKQAINFSSNQGQKGFKNLFSVYRIQNANYLIADTDNDRILEVSPEGEFIKGFGSHNIITETLFYPLTAVYNTENSVLSVLFSKSVDTSTIDISKIVLWIGGISLSLGAEDSISQKENNTKRIIDIYLSNDKIAQIRDSGKTIYIQFLSGSFPVSFDSTDSSRKLIGTRGLEVFVGDFTFIDGINHPIFANELSNGNIIIGNSEIHLVEKKSSEDNSNVRKVILNETIQFDISVDEPDEGVIIVWEQNIPIQVQGAVTFTSVNNNGTITVSPTTTDQVGEWTLTFVAKYYSSQGPIASTQTSVRLIVLSSEDSTATESAGPSPAVVEFDSDLNVVFSYDNVKFSDYSLGSVYEVDDNQLLIAGIVELEDFIPGSGEEAPANETFEEEAIRLLEKYRGKVITIEKTSKNIIGQYDCPDFSYASDACLDNNGFIVVAETCFSSNNGRVIKMDDFFNIIWQIEGGMFSKINDVRSLYNNNIIISS